MRLVKHFQPNVPPNELPAKKGWTDPTLSNQLASVQSFCSSVKSWVSSLCDLLIRVLDAELDLGSIPSLTTMSVTSEQLCNCSRLLGPPFKTDIIPLCYLLTGWPRGSNEKTTTSHVCMSGKQVLQNSVGKPFCKGPRNKYLGFVYHLRSLLHVLLCGCFVCLFLFLQPFKNVKILFSFQVTLKQALGWILPTSAQDKPQERAAGRLRCCDKSR